MEQPGKENQVLSSPKQQRAPGAETGPSLKFLSLPPTPRASHLGTLSHQQTPAASTAATAAAVSVMSLHRGAARQMTSSPLLLPSSARSSRHRRSIGSEFSSASSSFKEDLGTPHHLLHDPVVCSPALAQWLEHPTSIKSAGDDWSADEDDSFASAGEGGEVVATTEFCWSIDQLAHFYPADIDEQALTNIDPDRHVAAWTPRRRRQWQRRAVLLQQQIDQFFDPSNRVAPSPWPPTGAAGRAAGVGVGMRAPLYGGGAVLEPNIASPSCPRPPSRHVVSRAAHGVGDLSEVSEVTELSQLSGDVHHTRNNTNPTFPHEGSFFGGLTSEAQGDFSSPFLGDSMAAAVARLDLGRDCDDQFPRGDMFEGASDDDDDGQEENSSGGWQRTWSEDTTVQTLDAGNATAVREASLSSSSGCGTTLHAEHTETSRSHIAGPGITADHRVLRRRLFGQPRDWCGGEREKNVSEEVSRRIDAPTATQLVFSRPPPQFPSTLPIPLLQQAPPPPLLLSPITQRSTSLRAPPAYPGHATGLRHGGWDSDDESEVGGKVSPGRFSAGPAGPAAHFDLSPISIHRGDV
eukprot:m.85217 g.85217  ORF g.85217 m.85217 type:complete len:577 (+) comp13503_c2_seq1:134-1864(+)